MNSISIRFGKECVFHTLILKNFIQNIFGNHAPFEIIQLINMFYLKLLSSVSVKCNPHGTFIINQNRLYVQSLNDHTPKLFDFIPDKISSVSCGESHTMAITTHGELYVWGRNTYGQLGLGKSHYGDIYALPQKIDLHNVCMVSCGGAHTMAITATNELYSWGSNYHGQLGLGDKPNYSPDQVYDSPQKINLNNVISVSCGDYHTMCITTNGDLYAWGDNSYGQLGLGKNAHSYNYPRKINLGKIISVDCGANHTVAITADNEIYAWGNNNHGQMGSKTITRTNYPYEINLDNIVSVSCGSHYTIFVTTDHKLYVVGLIANKYYTSPQKINLDNVVSVDSGPDHMAVVTTNGKIYAWGSGDASIIDSPTEILFKF